MTDIVKRVNAFLESRPDVNPAAFGAHTKMAPSTIRHVLDGQRACSKEVGDELARVLRLAEAGEIFPIGAEAVVITEDHSQTGARRIRKARDFYKTETVRRIGQVLQYCAEQGAIAVITATYGVGKSKAVEHWRENAGRSYESIIFEFDEFSSRNTVDFVECLCDLMGVEYTRGPHNGGRTMRALCAHLADNPALLILDQVEGVNPRVLQLVRQIWDKTRHAGVGIALLAAPVLMERLQASKMRDLGALSSRIGLYCQLRGISETEIVQILKAEGVANVDDAALRVLYQAVGGSMRRLMAVADLLVAKHANKAVTTKTVAQLAESLWGLNLGRKESLEVVA